MLWKNVVDEIVKVGSLCIFIEVWTLALYIFIHITLNLSLLCILPYQNTSRTWMISLKVIKLQTALL